MRRALGALAVLVVLAGLAWWAWQSSVREADHDATATNRVAAPRPTYQCSMHPQIVSHEPGLCPICRMQLQRVDEEAPSKSGGESAAARSLDGARADEVAAGGVPGHAPFDLSTERQQLIGVTRTAARPRALQIDIRAPGRVAYDPELYQAIVEYREALRSRGRIGAGSLPEARSGVDSLARAVKLKLRQQGLSEAQIDALARAERDPVELLLPGEAVWVYAQVYEHEAGLVAPGQAMSITAPSRPGRTYSAKIGAVDAILDPTTRTLRVRALVPTPDADLRPESFVDVEIHVPLGEKLAIPEEAVLDTGEHQIVFVVKGEGRFEPRSVTLGQDAQAADAPGDGRAYYEVLAGLEAGEEVVTSANFLIDSESRFRAAIAAFQSSSHGGGQEPSPHRH